MQHVSTVGRNALIFVCTMKIHYMFLHPLHAFLGGIMSSLAIWFVRENSAWRRIDFFLAELHIWGLSWGSAFALVTLFLVLEEKNIIPMLLIIGISGIQILLLDNFPLLDVRSADLISLLKTEPDYICWFNFSLPSVGSLPLRTIILLRFILCATAKRRKKSLVSRVCFFFSLNKVHSFINNSLPLGRVNSRKKKASVQRPTNHWVPFSQSGGGVWCGHACVA